MFIYYRKTICEHGNFSGREKNARKKGQFKSIIAFLAVFQTKQKPLNLAVWGFWLSLLQHCEMKKGATTRPHEFYPLRKLQHCEMKKGATTQPSKVRCLYLLQHCEMKKGATTERLRFLAVLLLQHCEMKKGATTFCRTH